MKNPVTKFILIALTAILSSACSDGLKANKPLLLQSKNGDVFMPSPGYENDPNLPSDSPSPNSTRIYSPNGGIDLSRVTFVSSTNVSGWSRVSQTDQQEIRLTSVGFRPGIFHIDYTHKDQWAPYSVDIGGGTLQAATTWIFFYIDGQWYATGGERMRPLQTEKSLTRASDIGRDWLYDSNRWGRLTNYQPAPGEMVGFMVTQGSMRSDSNYQLPERTNIVMIPFPADGVDAYNSQIVWTE